MDYYQTESYEQEPMIPTVHFSASQMRSIARAKLKGQWLRTVGYYFLFSLIISMIGGFVMIFASVATAFCSLLFQSALVSTILFFIVWLIIACPMVGIMLRGFTNLVLSVLRDEPVSLDTLFTGFRRIGHSSCLTFLLLLFSFLWNTLFSLPVDLILRAVTYATGGEPGLSYYLIAILLMCIVSILIIWFMTRYAMAFFLSADDDSIGAMDAIRQSVRLMKKEEKTRFFKLLLSFSGWILLASAPALTGVVIFILNISKNAAGVDAFTGILAGFALYFLGLIVSIVAFLFLWIYIYVSAAVFYSGLTGNCQLASSDDEWDSAEYGRVDSPSTEETFHWNNES